MCVEEAVGFVEMWLDFIGREDIFDETWTSSDWERRCSSRV